MRSLADVIDARARQSPDALAFAAGDASMSWSAYARRSDAFAARLAELALAPRERVAVLLPDGPAVHAAWVGIEKAGLVAVGIGPRAGAAELRHLLAVSGAQALVAPARRREIDLGAFAEELRAAGLPLRHHVVVEDGCFEDAPGPGALEARRIAPDEPFLLNSTSGTTGMPKCVVHDQLRWFHFHELAVEAAELRPCDVFLGAIPAPFGFGIWTAHVTPALLGAPTVVLPRFDAEALCEAIERHRVSVLAAVTTQFLLMLDSPAFERCDLSSLRVLFTGGEAVPFERAAEFERRSGARVLQFYGSNETGALSRTTLRDTRERRLRSAGRAIESMHVRLFDEEGRDATASGRGQPGCKGPLLSRGYWNDAEANRALYTRDGWMLTGDVATLDAEGWLCVVGRRGDFIIRGGKNVSAPAVEAEVQTHPSVALAAAVAMPDSTFGERVCVYAVLRAGRSLELSALVEHLRRRGASPENLPERLVVVDELPRASGGKIAKATLREDIAQRLSREAQP